MQNRIKEFFLETRIINLSVENKGTCVSNEGIFGHTGNGRGGKKLNVGAKSCKESGANYVCSPPSPGKLFSQNSLQYSLDCYPCTLGSQEAPHFLGRIMPFNGNFTS